MVKGRDIASLGPIGILVKSWSIFRDNKKALLSIQLCLGLPSAMLGSGYAVLLLSYIQFSIPNPLTTGMRHTMRHTNHASEAVRINGSFGISDSIWSLIVFQLINTVISIVVQTIQSLSVAAYILVVGFVDDNRVVSFSEVVRTAIPNLWKSLVITNLFFLVLSKSATYLYMGLSFLSLESGSFMLPITLVCAVLFLAASFYLGITYYVASAVSVLEGKGGWIAFKRARKVMKQKWLVAFTVQYLAALPFVAFDIWLLSSIKAQLSGDSDVRDWTLILLIFTMMILLTMFFDLYNSLLSGVAYLSFKEFNESTTVPRSVVIEGEAKAGYQLVGSVDKEGSEQFVGKSEMPWENNNHV